MDAGEHMTPQAAREYFPRGLVQPEAGFRFSADALLLACFAGPGAARRIVDLGTGCGVVGLALLLRDGAGSACVTGLDVNPEMVRAATANAARLGLTERFSVMPGSVSEVRGSALEGGAHDLVVCNPPYRTPGSGRRPKDAGRDAARFEAVAPVSDFVRAAAYALRTKGRACFIGLPERLAGLLADMTASGLEVKRMRFVHSRIEDAARLVLVEGVRGAKPGMTVEAPLALYAGRGDATLLTDAAVEFCPFMACNAGPRSR